MNAIIYDLEIVKAIPYKKEPVLEGIEYCAGWHDHPNMGVSVIGVYEYSSQKYRVFCKDNFDAFVKLCQESELLVGFNNIPFDNEVLTHCVYPKFNEVFFPTSYDLLREIWAAAGLGPEFRFGTHTGYSLDAVAARNFGLNKTGTGAKAPIDWQQGRIGSVIDYCLGDVHLTKALFDRVLAGDPIVSPKTGNPLQLRKP